MSLTRIFTSFDYDHDENLMIMLRGQAANPLTPFDFADWSVKESLTGDWREKVRARIRRIDRMIVLCGQSTHTAAGVSEEITIAREESKPYFLRGYSNLACTKPSAAWIWDLMYDWTYENLAMMTQP
jgi:hypothetical protein